MQKNTKYQNANIESVGRRGMGLITRLGLAGSAVFVLSMCSSPPPPPPAEPAEPAPPMSLLELVERRDQDSIDELFGLLVEIDQVDSQGRSALHIATQQGNRHVAEVLLERGAEPNLQDTAGRTPFHVAVAEQHAELVSLLVSYGAGLYVADQGGRTPLDALIASAPAVYSAGLVPATVALRDGRDHEPLHYAARAGALGVVEHLIETGANLQARNTQRRTALDLALEHPESLSHMLVAEQLVIGGAPSPNDLEFTFFTASAAAQDWGMEFDGQNTALHIAAENGYGGIVQLLLSRSAELNAVNEQKQSPLHLAMHQAQHEIAGRLIESGADLSMQDAQDNGVFFFALDGPQPMEGVQFLLTQNADPNSRNAGGDTPIHIVLEKGLENQLIELLLAHDADPNLRNTTGRNPLLPAVERRNRAAAELLIAAESNVFAADNRGYSPVGVAIIQGVPTLRWMLDATGARARDESGNNFLHYAAAADRPEEVRFFIENGVAFQERNRDGNTPLHIAVHQQTPQAARALIAAGANLFSANNEERAPIAIAFTRDQDWWEQFFVPDVLALRDTAGNTLLHYAVNEADAKAVKGLLAYGVEVNAGNRNGITALHRAVQLRRIEISSILVNHGADVNARDSRGNSPLHLVNGTMSARIIEMLLAAGAPINTRNNEGRTPLHEAARRDSSTAVRALIAGGADVEIADNRGRTVIFEVAESGSLSLAETLLHAGASIQVRDQEGNTPLHVAIEERRLDIVALARRRGADIFAQNRQGVLAVELGFTQGIPIMETLVSRFTINQRSNNGNTVLHLALLREAPDEVIEYLMGLGPDLGIRNANGLRPIDIAEEHGNETLIRLLRQVAGS